MSYDTTVTVSWTERLKQSLTGLTVGCTLIFAMVWLLFWNEGRAVQTARSLAEGAGLVIAVPAAFVNPVNQGRLVHLTGKAQTSAPLTDPAFAVTLDGLRLMRSVEMYQWQEQSSTERKTALGGSETQVTTYRYLRDWSGSPQDSAGFHEPDGHRNPPMQFAQQTFQAQQATLGAWQLDAEVLARAGGSRPYALPAALQPAIQRAVGATPVHVVDGALFVGTNPSLPQVGDYRIRYHVVPAEMLSVVGRQEGQGIALYPTQSGDALLLVETGNVPAQAMFDQAASSNTTFTWILRLVGLVLLIAGFRLLLAPLVVVASVLPPLGGLLSLGTGLVAGVLGLSVGALTIGLAWLFYRPLVALAIALVAAAIVGGMLWLARQRRQAAQPTGELA